MTAQATLIHQSHAGAVSQPPTVVEYSLEETVAYTEQMSL